MRAEIAANTSFGPRPPEVSQRTLRQPMYFRQPRYFENQQREAGEVARLTATPPQWPVTASKILSPYPIHRRLFKGASLARPVQDRSETYQPCPCTAYLAIQQPIVRRLHHSRKTPEGPQIRTNSFLSTPINTLHPPRNGRQYEPISIFWKSPAAHTCLPLTSNPV